MTAHPGDRFLCIKDYLMEDVNEDGSPIKAYTCSNVYVVTDDYSYGRNFIMKDDLNDFHHMYIDREFFEHFCLI
jgi:hypothetical protein